ncbi:hypothetical protein [Fodinibius sp.]|nr:hypothetical protein [Fodinibius sp.]MDZ7658070.1 hypothetical protein [Fodinibius sp.]
MTPDHPVLTDQGWIPAGDLQTDMTIYDLAQEYNQHQRQPCGGMYHKE